MLEVMLEKVSCRIQIGLHRTAPHHQLRQDIGRPGRCVPGTCMVWRCATGRGVSLFNVIQRPRLICRGMMEPWTAAPCFNLHLHPSVYFGVSSQFLTEGGGGLGSGVGVGTSSCREFALG